MPAFAGAVARPGVSAVSGRARFAESGVDPLQGRHVGALDGLRGLALLLVFMHHLNYSYPVAALPAGAPRTVLLFVAENGWLGVDVFFVLSGFLITSMLLKSRGATNYYRVFYVRRLLRIAPMYYAMLMVTFLLPWPKFLGSSHLPFGVQVWWWLGLSNWRTAAEPYLLPVVSLFWSLAVEEQFYLVWPAAVRRLRRGWLLGVALGAVVLELVLRLLPAVRGAAVRSPDLMYRLTPLHWDGLFLGAALAIAMSAGWVERRWLPWLRLAGVTATVGAAAMLMAGFRFYTTPVIALAVAAGIAVLVMGDGRGWVARVLAAWPLALVGRYSYFMYVTQILVIVVCQEHVFRHVAVRWPLGQMLVCDGGTILVSFGLGAVSWRWIEGPLNGLKRKLPYAMAEARTTRGAETRLNEECRAAVEAGLR